MVFVDVFILVSSRIRQITLKSMCILYPSKHAYSPAFRVIIAGIRNLGCCPCPRCLMPLCTVDSMGKPRDMMQRNSLLRVDDARRRNRVVAARKILYEKQYTVNSKAIENLLHGESLVPTMVGYKIIMSLRFSSHLSRTRFRQSLRNSGFACTSCLLLISCMSLNSVFGR